MMDLKKRDKNINLAKINGSMLRRFSIGANQLSFKVCLYHQNYKSCDGANAFPYLISYRYLQAS